MEHDLNKKNKTMKDISRMDTGKMLEELRQPLLQEVDRVMKDISRMDTGKMLEELRQPLLQEADRTMQYMHKVYRDKIRFTIRDDDLNEEEKLQALLNSIRVAELKLKVEKEDRQQRYRHFKKIKEYFSFEDNVIQLSVDGKIPKDAKDFINLLQDIDKNHILGSGKNRYYSFVSEVILLFYWLRIDYLEVQKDIDAFKKLEKYGVKKENYLSEKEVKNFELFSKIGLNGIADFVYIYFQDKFTIEEKKSKKLFSILLHGHDKHSRIGKGKKVSSLTNIPDQDHEYKFL